MISWAHKMLPGFFNHKEENMKEFKEFFEQHSQYWKAAVFHELVEKFELLSQENLFIRAALGETAYNQALKEWKFKKRE